MKNVWFNWRIAVKSPNFLPISIKLLLLLIFPLVTYFQDFVQLFNLALSNQEVQYVFLVPFVAAYFFYKRRKAFSISSKNSVFHDLTGVSLCLLSLLVYIWGSYSFYSLQLHLLSLPFFVAGLTLLIFGFDALRLLVFPITLLTLLSPFPLFFMDAYGGSLMSSDGALATFILKPFFPIGITYNPIVVLSTVTTAGAKIQFSLDSSCSGIYCLTAFLFFAVVFGYLAVGSKIKKIGFIGLAVLAAYLLNVFRIAALVVVGHFFGIGLALDFFHVIGGTVLAFIGILFLLYFGSKLLKLSYIQRKVDFCSFCKDFKTTCAKCGRVLQWPKTKISWKRMAIVLLFLLICADLIAQASAVNYNMLMKGKQTAVNFNPVTGELGAFSNGTGWSSTFTGRQAAVEGILDLTFAGNYFLQKNNASGSMNAIFEVADLQLKFHTWDVCLNYQSYPLDTQNITALTIYDKGSNIVNGEIMVANAPTLNQTLALVYWDDSLNLETNGTITNYCIQVTLYNFIANSNNQTTQAMNINAATTQLLSVSQNLEQIWSQSKNSSYSFVVDLYRNVEAFAVVVIALLFVSATALSVKQLMVRSAARRKIASLSDEYKRLLAELKKTQFAKLNKPQQGQENLSYSANTIGELLRQQIIHEKISIKNDELYLEWSSY